MKYTFIIKKSVTTERKKKMDFYTYAYIDGQVHTTYLYHYAALLGVTLAWLIAGIKYMRNRLQTKYRDLTIIFLLIGIFWPELIGRVFRGPGSLQRICPACPPSWKISVTI